MNPKIEMMTSLKLMGLKTTLRLSREDRNDMTQVPVLWQKLASQQGKLQRKNQERMALITGDLPLPAEEQSVYHALFEVEEFTDIEGFVQMTIPAGKIARFVHVGRPELVGQTAMRALTEWLPQSGELLRANQELFIYPAAYDRTNPDATFEYCLLLK